MNRIDCVIYLIVLWGVVLSFCPAASLMAAKRNAGISADGDQEIGHHLDALNPEAEETTPEFQGEFKFGGTVQSLNNSSIINPDNETLGLNGSETVLDVHAQISDYLTGGQNLRWVVKSYGFSSYPAIDNSGWKEDFLRIDEAFFDGGWRNWFVSIGKRRVNWGTTSAWNPLNVIVPAKNPMLFDPPTEGHPLFLLNFASDHFNLDLIATRDFDRNWDGTYNRWGARLGMLWGDKDIGVYYFDGEAYAEPDVPVYLTTPDYSRLMGISYSSNFFSDATLYCELASFSENTRYYYDRSGNQMEKDAPVIRGALGSVITLKNNASFHVEWYYNGSGYSLNEKRNYYSWVDSNLSTIYPLAIAESEKELLRNMTILNYQNWAMNKNYLFLAYNKLLLDRYEFGTVLITAEDASGMFSVKGAYSISDYYLLETILYQYFGDRNSEFGNFIVKNSAAINLSSSF